jgi:putative PIN family toxin of toxin-antitoxin system
MTPLRPGAVFDCNVFVQAITRSGGPAAKALRLVERNAITLYISRPILAELRRTLEYPAIRQKNPHVSQQLIDAFLSHILFRGVFVRHVPHVFELSRDPNDEPYIDLVAACAADFLVTRDNDLLSLASDHSIEAKQFRQRFPALSLLNPVDFLAEIRRIAPF